MMKSSSTDFVFRRQQLGLIHNQIEETLQSRTNRNLDRAVCSLNKLLITFLTTGDFYITMADFGGIHKSTAGKIIKSCITRTKLNFYNLSHFPRVIGAIDCTHIKIISPGGDNAEVYLLITLRFLTTGDFYITMADFGGIHKSTAGKIIKSCITKTKLNFYNLSHFPRVIGAIDCTHIKIISPGGDNAEVYLLITLRFLTTGDFYITMADFGGIHKSTAGKIIKSCMTKTKLNFYNLSHFPRVIGAIDCTHIKIISPGGDNDEVYRKRKGQFFKNWQVVCNAKLKITDLVCHWFGSANDSHIFNNSAVKMRFESGVMENGVLLGDIGYGVQSYSITPLDEPRTETEHLYNEAQISSSIWKRRFPILSMGIRCKIDMAQMIIVACAILHNIAREQDEEYFENDEWNNVLPKERQEGQKVQNDARSPFIDYFQNS